MKNRREEEGTPAKQRITQQRKRSLQGVEGLIEAIGIVATSYGRVSLVTSEREGSAERCEDGRQTQRVKEKVKL